MKNIKTLAAVAILVAGSIACQERNPPADATSTDQPVAVTATETSTTTETTTTVAPTDTALPPSTDTAVPATGTDATAVPSTGTDSTSSAPANPPAQQ